METQRSWVVSLHHPKLLAPAFRFSHLFPSAFRRWVWFLAAVAGTAAAEPAHEVDIPAGDAIHTLKRFAVQTQREIVFSSEDVRAVQTNAVRGKLSPSAALEQMLERTTLVATRDQKTGAFAVARRPAAKSPDPPAPLPRKSTLAPAPPPPMKPRSLATWLSALAATFSMSAADNADPKSDSIVLSPFEVRTDKDKGYRATNSISGTRLNAPIKDLPMSLEVITEELVRDLGAADLREALRYSSGVVLDSQSDYGDARSSASDDGEVLDRRGSGGQTASATSTVYKLRGFATAITLRNGFRRTASTDSINISRAEVVRGPSALLYGIGNFGGIVNVVTKKPASRPQTSLSAMAGSDDYFRATLDTTAPLGTPWRLGYRLTGSWQQRGWWQDFNDLESHFIAPTFSFRPLPQTQVMVELETGRERIEGNGFFGIRDKTSGSPTQARNQPFLPLGGRDFKTFRLSGPDTFVETRPDNALLEVTQNLGRNLTLVAGANFSHLDRRSRNIDEQRLINDAATATQREALWRPWTSQSQGYFADFAPEFLQRAIVEYRWRTAHSHENREQYRVEAAYAFEVARTRHTLLLGSTWDRSRNKLTGERTSNNPATGASAQNYRAIDDPSYFRFGAPGELPLVAWQKASVFQWNRGHYLVHHGRYLGDRLHSIAGLRYDRADSRRNNFNAVTGAATNVQTRTNPDPSAEVSPQIGLNYRIAGPLSVFALFSTGLQPVTNVDGAGVPFDPTKARNLEAGLKMDFLEGRVSGTLSGFRIERSNFPRRIWWAPRPAGTAFDPARPISYYLTPSPVNNPGLADYAARTFFYDNPADREIIRREFNAASDKNAPFSWLYDTNTTRANNPSMDIGADVPSDDEAKGFDAQLVLSPLDNWQTVLSYAYVQRKITSGGVFVRHPVYNEFSIWYMDRLGPTDTWGGGNHYANKEDSSTFEGFNTNKGQSLDDTPHHTFSVWTNYRVTSGALRGWAMGAGVQWNSGRDWRAGASGDGTTFIVRDTDPSSRVLDREITDPKLNVDALLSYTTKLAEREWRFALNVYNLLDDQQRYGEIYNRPRNFRLSAAVQF